jgi:hypothetical protein
MAAQLIKGTASADLVEAPLGPRARLPGTRRGRATPIQAKHSPGQQFHRDRRLTLRGARSRVRFLPFAKVEIDGRRTWHLDKPREAEIASQLAFDLAPASLPGIGWGFLLLEWPAKRTPSVTVCDRVRVPATNQSVVGLASAPIFFKPPDRRCSRVLDLQPMSRSASPIGRAEPL